MKLCRGKMSGLWSSHNRMLIWKAFGCDDDTDTVDIVTFLFGVILFNKIYDDS